MVFIFNLTSNINCRINIGKLLNKKNRQDIEYQGHKKINQPLPSIGHSIVIAEFLLLLRQI